VPKSVEILPWNFRKKLFWENFSEILCKPRRYQNLWNFALLSEILFWVRIVLKKFTRVLWYVVCTQVRRHVHKQITKRRYGGVKPGRFVFEKPVLFTLGLGLTTPYSLDILEWNFHQMFVTVSTEFWMRFEPQIRSTRLAINFLFISSRAEKKVRLCVKLFDFFRGRILIRLTWNFSRFVPNLVEILTWNFRKNYFGRIFQKFCLNQGYPIPKVVKFRPTFRNCILGPYCAEKDHTSTLICCLHPSKDARP